MISHLQRGLPPVPRWLAEIPAGNLPAELPLHDILTDSLYYPSSGTNGAPVEHLGGFIHSFVYVDWGIDRERLQEEVG